MIIDGAATRWALAITVAAAAVAVMVWAVYAAAAMPLDRAVWLPAPLVTVVLAFALQRMWSPRVVRLIDMDAEE